MKRPRRFAKVPGITTGQTVWHACGHEAFWLFDSDRGVLEAATLHRVGQYDCPACGGETGNYQGLPPIAVRIEDYGATVFVECRPEDVLLGI